MGLLEAIVLILVGVAVAALGWCCKKVSDHDARDAVLIQRVGRLEEDVAEIKADVKSANSKLDTLVGQRAALNQTG